MTAPRKSRSFFPARFPNLLANGSQGIAVGMATSIPPHNAAELCDAALHLIEHPNAESRRAAEVRARPGFPDRRRDRRCRGGDRRSLRHRPRLVPRARALGQGRLRPRHLSDRRSPKSPGWCRSARLVEKHRRAAQRARSCRSSPTCATSRPRTSGSCWSRAPARSIPSLLMESLFKLTELESRIPLNMNVLVKGRIPKVVGLADALARVARPSPRRADAALAPPAGGDRASARNPRRLS